MSIFLKLSEWIPQWAKGEGLPRHGHADVHGAAERVESDTSSEVGSQTAPESLENYHGSPTGSRASSIAGDANKRNTQTRSIFLESEDSSFVFRRTPELGAVERRTFIGWEETISWVPTEELENGSSASGESFWDTGALRRPLWEPPVLDYRKFEEEGRMYDCLNRHPDTKPEEWYSYTDPEVENELLEDYHDFAVHAQAEARDVGDEEREKFYAGLRRELDIDRFETSGEFNDVKDRIYGARRSGTMTRSGAGHRVQRQFNDLRKRWFDVDSEDSAWDEQEWRIFGIPHKRQVESEGLASLTRGNLLRIRLFEPVAQELPHMGQEDDLPPNRRLADIFDAVAAGRFPERITAGTPTTWDLVFRWPHWPASSLRNHGFGSCTRG